MNNMVYLAISFSGRSKYSAEIETIKNTVEELGLKLLVFVEKYNFDKSQEKQMMQQACQDINDSVLLIAEVSEKAIGVGIEIGYAVALHKPVIYLRNDQSEYSKTVGGIVDNHIVYASLEDLGHKLRTTIRQVVKG